MTEKRDTVYVLRPKDRPTLQLQWVDPDTGGRRTRSADCFMNKENRDMTSPFQPGQNPGVGPGGDCHRQGQQRRTPTGCSDRHAVRCARLALDRGIGGALIGPSSYFMKSPPEQYSDEVAHDRTEEFIAGKIAR